MMCRTQRLVLEVILTGLITDTGTYAGRTTVHEANGLFSCAVHCTQSRTCGHISYYDTSVMKKNPKYQNSTGTFTKNNYYNELDDGIVCRWNGLLDNDLTSRDEERPRRGMVTFTRQEAGSFYESDSRGSFFKLQETDDPIIIFCSEPPALENGLVDYQILFPGSEVTYRCKEGFSFCDSQEQTSRCLKNGSLTKMSKQCHETTWINPSVRFDQILPCPLLNGSVLEVIGSPSKPSVFSINLKGQEPTRMFHMSVRIKYKHGGERQIFFNTRTAAGWLKEYWSQKFDFKAGQEFNITILVRKECYTVWVNNRHITDYKHMLPVKQVQMITIRDDVTIRRVTLRLRPEYNN